MIKASTPKLETATFGGGCFWGIEEAFLRTPGVKETAAGYMGGHTENPTYEEVCGDRTGHAEVVHVKFDPSEVRYEDLLKVFWDNHNPTTKNRDGPNFGSQYRSVIFTHTPEQEKLAKVSKEKLEKTKTFPKPIVTKITAAMPFYRAEEYHQQYLRKQGLESCHM